MKMITPATTSKAYDMLQQRLEIKDGKKEVFKLMTTKERKTRDQGDVRCTEVKDSLILIEETRMKET